MKNQDLVWARESAGLSQAEAAGRIGVTRVTFARWESGTTPIPNAKYNAFLAAVGVSLAEVSAALKALPPRPAVPEVVAPPKPDPMAAVRSDAEVWTMIDGVNWPSWTLGHKLDRDASLEANGGFDADGTCPSIGREGRYYADYPLDPKRLGASYQSFGYNSHAEALLFLAIARMKSEVKAAGREADYDRMATKCYAPCHAKEFPTREQGVTHAQHALLKWWEGQKDVTQDLDDLI